MIPAVARRSFAALVKQNVGFLGCGNMGHFMIKHLISHGHSVTAFDIQKNLVDDVVALGAKPAQTVAEVAKDKDIVLTMLPNEEASLKVYTEGEGCILQSAKKGAFVIESSTISPDTAKLISGEADRRGLIAVDAPVSGAQIGAINGTLTFMVGIKEKAQFDRLKPFLECMGKSIIYCGQNGAGEAAKLCNNYIFAVTLAAVAEGYNMLEKSGMDLKIMNQIAETSSSGCFTISKYHPIPNLVETSPSSKNYDGGFPTTHMLKDVKLAINAADKVGASMDTGKLVAGMLEKVTEKGLGRKDFSIVNDLISGKLK